MQEQKLYYVQFLWHCMPRQIIFTNAIAMLSVYVPSELFSLQSCACALPQSCKHTVDNSIQITNERENEIHISLY